MNEQSQEQQDQSSDDVNGALLMVECYSDGEMGFSCDWQDDDTGVSCMATILTYLGEKNLANAIIANLEGMFEDDEKINQVERLKSFYLTLKKLSEQNKAKEDDVVIPPLDASTLM